MRIAIRVFAVTLLLAIGLEAFLRVGILAKISLVRDPDLYTDWTSDEDYWKLRHLWVKRVATDNSEMADPMLGWAPPKTAENPLGAHTEGTYSISSKSPVVLFLGDLFVQGATPMPQRIPQLLSQRVGSPVFNLGVKGYGWDQTLLRGQQARRFFEKPVSIVGLLSVGIDRSLLAFRTGLKPFFAIEDGQLKLRGVPVRTDVDQWVAENPPAISSYGWALISRRVKLLHAGNALEINDRREDKRELNSLILRQMIEENRVRDEKLLFVLFYNREEMAYEGWREKFMKEQMKETRANFIDSKRVLLKKAGELRKPMAAFYEPGGCLNELGNEAVVEAIAERLKFDYLPANSTPG